VQEALYRGLPELLREPYHVKLGAALEERQGKRDGAVAVELCEHFFGGGAGGRARPYLQDAIAHLGDGYLYDEAIALAQRALAVDGLYAGEERIALLLQTAARLEQRARHEEDRAVLNEALELADELGDAALRSKVRSHLGRLGLWTAEYSDAHDWFVEARDLAVEAGDEQAERTAVGNLGLVYYRERRFDEALAIFERIRSAARDRGDKHTLAVSTLNVGNVHWCRGEFDAARVLYEEYRALSREIGYRAGEALAAGNLGNVLYAMGRLADAQELYEEVLQLSAETGDRHKVALFESSMGKLALDLGRPDRAREHYQRSHELSVEIGMPREVAGALWGLGVTADEKEELAKAREHLEDSLALHEEIAEVECVTGVHASLALVARAEDRDKDAVRHLDIALERARTVNDEAQEAGILAMRASLPGGDASSAEQKFEMVRARMAVPAEMKAAWWLYQATGKPEYRARARELLERLRAGAPEQDRDAVLEGSRLHRAIAAAAG